MIVVNAKAKSNNNDIIKLKNIINDLEQETLKERGHRVTVWISGKDIENNRDQQFFW